MAKIIQKCPTCSKTAQTKAEMKIGSLVIRTYECGHTVTLTGVESAQEDTLDILSLDGKRPFKYQIEGARFLENSNGRALLADEMGVGKTIQFLMYVIAHPEVRPFVVFTKAGTRVQWGKECVRWGDLMVQVVEEGSKAFLLPGFDGYIISTDSAWRIGTKSKTIRDGDGRKRIEYEPIPGKSLPEQLTKLGVKTIGIDECQSIKNVESKRTKAIQSVCKDRQCVIGMSGTPIKNNAAEYFPILNILRPDKFPNKSKFVYETCDSYFNGYATKTGGIRDIKKFMNDTKDFIIRRTRAEVLPDLPTIFRQYSFHELGEMVEDMYVQTFKEFADFMTTDAKSASAMERASNILAYLTKMRHLAGLAKIDPCVEAAEEFILSTDRKLAIFVHHKDVGETIRTKLEQRGKEWPAEFGKGILQLTASLDSYQREEVITKWKSPDYRICVLSTLASGEGLNLQFCSDAFMVERQWNPANEEQAEARFPRPGSMADKIAVMYFVALATVDEFFSEIVERKREICARTMAGEAVKWDESSLMRELTDIMVQKGGKKWNL